MPRNYSRYKRRRTYSRRRSFKRRPKYTVRRKSKVSRKVFKGNLMPDQYFTKMSYGDKVTITSTSGAVGTQQYQINNLQDPDYTNGGTNHQPNGYDQMTVMYNYYTVLGVKYDIRVMNYSYPGVLTMTANDNFAQQNANYTESMEQPYNRHVYLAQGSTVKPTRLTGFYKLRKILGKSKYDDMTATAFGSSVADAVYMHLNYQSWDTSSTSDVELVIKLTFYVKCSGRKQIAQS